MLPLDQEVRYSHGEDCLRYGASTPDNRDRLYVKRTRKGTLYNCFNCGYSAFKPSKGASLEETKERLYGMGRVQKTDGTVHISLPFDLVYDLPSAAKLWLDRYNITEDEIRKYRFGYSEKLNRLILPLYNQEGELVFWQGRNLGKATRENPKYLNVRSSKDCAITINGAGSDSSKVAIVEGILDAIKVGRQIHAIPLLGSHLSTKVLQKVGEYDTIFSWLDMDKRMSSIKFCNKIKLFTGKKCKSIITELDPKDQSDEVIRRLVLD